MNLHDPLACDARNANCLTPKGNRDPSLHCIDLNLPRSFAHAAAGLKIR